MALASIASASQYYNNLDDEEKQTHRIADLEPDELTAIEQKLSDYLAQHADCDSDEDFTDIESKVLNYVLDNKDSVIDELIQGPLVRLKDEGDEKLIIILKNVVALTFAHARQLQEEAANENASSELSDVDQKKDDTVEQKTAAAEPPAPEPVVEKPIVEKPAPKPATKAKTTKKTAEASTSATTEKPAKVTKPRAPKKKQAAEPTIAGAPATEGQTATPAATPKKARAPRKPKAAPASKTEPAKQKTPEPDALATHTTGIATPTSAGFPPAQLSPSVGDPKASILKAALAQNSDDEDIDILLLQKQLQEAEAKLQEVRSKKRKAIEELKGKIAKTNQRLQKVESEVAVLEG